MGMSASQARLLSITARISDLELAQQSVSYSKQRLSDQTEQVNDQYLEALNSTKYQIITGYNNSSACYNDFTYNELVGVNSVAIGKQYLVKDTSGKVLVSNAIAKAFKNANADYNKFLANLGYNQSDLDTTDEDPTSAAQAVHNAWDRYLESVNESIGDSPSEHYLIDNNDKEKAIKYNYQAFSSDAYDGYPTYQAKYISGNGTKAVLYLGEDGGYYRKTIQLETNDDNEVGYYTKDDDGNAVWNAVSDVTYDEESKYYNYDGKDYAVLYYDQIKAAVSEESTKAIGNETVETLEKAIPYNGTRQEQRELYDYAVALTEDYASAYNKSNKSFQSATSYTTNNSEMINYYTNIFNEIRTSGYSTLNEKDETKFKDTDWFVNQLKSGNLSLYYYSSTDNDFVGTSIDDDESITEKEDSSAIALAEQDYQTQMDAIEAEDKQFDLELNRLETEHKALQTEYDSVKTVISKNVEKTFNIFENA